MSSPHQQSSRIANVPDIPLLRPAFGTGVLSELQSAPTGLREAGRFAGLRRAPRRRVAAAALAAVVGASSWTLYQAYAPADDRVSPSGRTIAAEQVLVADVEAHSADSLSARALTYWLRNGLERSTSVHSVRRAEIDAALERMTLPAITPVTAEVARELALRNGYEVIVTSELTPLGDGYVLSARLTTVGGHDVATVSEHASSHDELIPATDRITRAVRAALGESRKTLVSTPPLQQVTTASMRALELYTLAQDISNVSRGNGQNPPPMFTLLSEALAIDSTFAMAHRRLGTGYSNLGRKREALHSFRAAERFSHKLGDMERLVTAVTLHANLRDFDRALAGAAEMLRLDPGSQAARIWFALVSMTSGQYDLAVKTVGDEIGTTPFWPNVRTYQGRGVEALDSARAFYRRHVDSTGSPWHRMSRSRLASFHAVQFGYDSALVYAVPGDRSDRGTPLVMAVARFAKGQIGEALAIQTRRATDVDGELTAFGTTAVESFTAMASVLINSDRESASRRLDLVLADSNYRNRSPADQHIRPILALSLVGRSVDARRELAAIEQASNEDVLMARSPELDLARGAVRLAERRPLEAIPLLQRAATQVTWASQDSCRVCALPWLGRAFEEAGHADSAAITYERYLSTGDPFRLLADAAWRAFVLRRLGELHVQRGDTVQAIMRLLEFAELWQNADDDLQPEVAKAKRRVTELRRSVLASDANRVVGRR
jgi:tetratricopeptide (TPR) repeat protein